MTRYEVKLVGRERDLPRVAAELRLLPSLLQTAHPSRIVQSVYLDTHAGTALHDNLAGIASREKVRLRWYGEACDLVQGRLERKRRDNGLGDKDTFALTAPLRVEGAGRHRFIRDLRAAVPARLLPWLHDREPAQWIRYRRDYLATADGRLRVTLDRDLAAFDLRFDACLSCRRATPLPRLLVVEIKAAQDQREAIERWLQDMPLRPSRCSKFVLAALPAEAPEAAVWD